MSAPEQQPVSVQGSFLCTEAHPDLGGSLVVLAISESLLPWEDYCKALPSSAVPDDMHAADTSNCCTHPAVHAAAMKVPANTTKCLIFVVTAQLSQLHMGSSA